MKTNRPAQLIWVVLFLLPGSCCFIGVGGWALLVGGPLLVGVGGPLFGVAGLAGLLVFFFQYLTLPQPKTPLDQVMVMEYGQHYAATIGTMGYGLNRWVSVLIGTLAGEAFGELRARQQLRHLQIETQTATLELSEPALTVPNRIATALQTLHATQVTTEGLSAGGWRTRGYISLGTPGTVLPTELDITTNPDVSPSGSLLHITCRAYRTPQASARVAEMALEKFVQSVKQT